MLCSRLLGLFVLGIGFVHAPGSSGRKAPGVELGLINVLSMVDRALLCGVDSFALSEGARQFFVTKQRVFKSAFSDALASDACMSFDEGSRVNPFVCLIQLGVSDSILSGVLAYLESLLMYKFCMASPAPMHARLLEQELALDLELRSVDWSGFYDCSSLGKFMNTRAHGVWGD